MVQKKDTTIRILEREIDSLNRKIAAFKNESAKRQSYANSTDDPLVHVASLTDKNASLKLMAKEKDATIAGFKQKVLILEATAMEASIKANEANQKIAVVEAASHRDEQTQRALDVFLQLQSIWREIGSSTESDEDVLKSIENCLEDSCERKLNEARGIRETMVFSIDATVEKVKDMKESLGLPCDDVATFANLRLKQEYWEGVLMNVLPKYQAAESQARFITDAATGIQSSLGLTVADLPENLRRLVCEGTKNDIVRDLTSPFLSKCEEELSLLRSEKSEIMVRNDVRQNEVSQALTEMNIVGSESYQIILDIIKRYKDGLPIWWDNELGQQVCQAVTAQPSIPKLTNDYTDHLSVVHQAVLSVASCRRSLSDGLHNLIERAQETLLSTVDGGHDAVEACASFREALLRLPKLSKERISTCLTQIADLIPGVDAMIQSEIEALTVVWEALGTPSAARGTFWESIDARLASANSDIFNDILGFYPDRHEWLHMTAKQGQKDYFSLEKKLVKLQAVHKEVETLRARQDAKSKVLSLDSELRLLNAQLSEFEEKKCNKDRLLSRQTASSHLLREERYRKQMKAKFTSKLEQLAEHLKVWNEKNSTNFDPSILSEDVRMLLKSVSWIDQRKEFMHLRTTKPKRFGKRRIDRAGSSESDESYSPIMKHTRTLTATETAQKTNRFKGDLVPTVVADEKLKPTKRKADNARSISKLRIKKQRTETVVVAKDSILAAPSDSNSAQYLNVLSPHQTNIRENSDACKTKNKRMTLPPFGHVLEQSQTPRGNLSAQENLFTDK